jgi:hypothetical protein
VRCGLAALVVGLVGCGATPKPVDLCGNWPDKPGDFDDITEAWTRHGEFRRDYQQVLTVDATIKSPEWRAAHVARTAKARGLDAASTEALFAENKAAAIAALELELIVTTWDRKENELSRPNPVWTVTLIDGNGRSIAPLKVRRDKRPKHVLRAEFPQVPDFHEAYVATFPADPPVLVCGSKTVRLRVAGERGSVELVWNAP